MDRTDRRLNLEYWSVIHDPATEESIRDVEKEIKNFIEVRLPTLLRFKSCNPPDHGLGRRHDSILLMQIITVKVATARDIEAHFGKLRREVVHFARRLRKDLQEMQDEVEHRGLRSLDELEDCLSV